MQSQPEIKSAINAQIKRTKTGELLYKTLSSTLSSTAVLQNTMRGGVENRVNCTNQWRERNETVPI